MAVRVGLGRPAPIATRLNGILGRLLGRVVRPVIGADRPGG